jgi:hypothetical protein
VFLSFPIRDIDYEWESLTLTLHSLKASYGQPEVGNEAFAQFVSRQDSGRGKNYRVEHNGDPVPNAIRGIQGRNSLYRVVTPGYFIRATLPGQQVTAADISLRSGTNDLNPGTVSNSFPGNLITIAEHGFYLNQISACGATPLIPPALIASAANASSTTITSA